MTRSSFGSIKPHGDGKWRVFISEGYGRDGKRIRTSKVFDTKDEAERFLAKKRLEKGHYCAADRDMTVSDYWNHDFYPYLQSLVEGGELAIGTLKTRESYYKHLDRLLGNEAMSGLTLKYIERQLLKIQAKHSRYGAFKLLKQMYTTAVEDELLKSSPFIRKCRISEPKVNRQDILHTDEIAQWIEGMRGFRFEAAALIMFGGGLRREEVAALKWENDIEYREGFLYIRISKATTQYDDNKKPKTDDSERVVIIAEPLASRIEALRRPGYLVGNKDGEKMSPLTYTAYYRDWCAENDIRYVKPKNLRNSYATFRQTKKCDPTITSKSLGHANLSIDYDHYFIVQEEALKSEAQKMGDEICAILCQSEETQSSEDE